MPRHRTAPGDGRAHNRSNDGHKWSNAQVVKCEVRRSNQFVRGVFAAAAAAAAFPHRSVAIAAVAVAGRPLPLLRPGPLSVRAGLRFDRAGLRLGRARLRFDRRLRRPAFFLGPAAAVVSRPPLVVPRLLVCRRRRRRRRRRRGSNGRDSNPLQRRNCGNCRAIAPLPRPNCTAIGGRRGCGGARTRRSRAPIMRRYCGPVAVQSKRCCCAVARLLPCYCGATLLQRCCRTVASYCRTDAALLQHCCGTVAALLQHCCSTIAANAPGFEGGGGGGGLGWACRPASESPSRRPILQSLQVLQLLQLLQPPSQI